MAMAATCMGFHPSTTAPGAKPSTAISTQSNAPASSLHAMVQLSHRFATLEPHHKKGLKGWLWCYISAGSISYPSSGEHGFFMDV